MEYKYIGGRKFKKMGITQQENEQMELRSMLSIRSNLEALNSIFNEISMYSPSMISPAASPIKPNTNSNTTFNYTPIRQFIQTPSFTQQRNEKQADNPEAKTLKKKSISSVHFTSYMKPIGKISDKLKGILEQQKEYRQMQAEKQLAKINNIKKKTKQEFKNVESKYKGYKQAHRQRQQGLAVRTVKRQEEQMSGVTFMPTINHNIPINCHFEQRQQIHHKKKEQRSYQVVQEILSKQTFKPKINASTQIQSKVKEIWKKSPSKKDQSKQVESFSHDFEQLFKREGVECRVRECGQMLFINK